MENSRRTCSHWNDFSSVLEWCFVRLLGAAFLFLVKHLASVVIKIETAFLVSLLW